MSNKQKRQRKKIERSGKRNPEWNRVTWTGKKLITQQDTTLQGEIRRQERKYKPNYLNQKDDEGSSVFYYLLPIKV